jgi:hypothetical protein
MMMHACPALPPSGIHPGWASAHTRPAPSLVDQRRTAQHMRSYLASFNRQVGNANPYAHWTSTFNTDKNGTANNCTKASDAAKYDQFYGLDPTNVTQQNDAALYLTTAGTDLKYGWVVTSCTTTMGFICQVPSTIFPCYPPPASPPPPPSPPSPPSPPMGTKCGFTSGMFAACQKHRAVCCLCGQSWLLAASAAALIYWLPQQG